MFFIAGIVPSRWYTGRPSTPRCLLAWILFVAFEVAFYGFVLMLQLATPLENIAWYQVGAANLVAAGLMGRYLWIQHPELTNRLNESLSGR
jgi:hypothetical protein